MKDKTKTEDEIEVFDNWQYSYKIIINSVYGLLSQNSNPFFKIEIASSVTSMGRYMLGLMN